MANSSCDWPKTVPFFSLTPMTRKCRPSILIVCLEGILGAEQAIGRCPNR